MGDRPASRSATAAAPGATTLRPDRWTVQWFSSLDSTNRWLLDRARDGAPAGLVAIADHQRAGRGRRGRSWEAPPGSSLLASILLRPRVAPEELHVVTLRTALALADALESTAHLQVLFKWPNDLVIGDRKIAGLLAEADLAGSVVEYVVVGIGCNLVQTEFPPELAGIATSVAMETPGVPERDVLVDALLSCLDVRLDASSGAIRADYRERLSTLGRDVIVELEERVVAGRARDVDQHGRLIVEQQPAETVAVAVGDVVHLRPAT